MRTGLVIDPNRIHRAVITASPASYVTPSMVDLRSQMLPPNDQGSSQACAAYAMAGCIEFHNWRTYGTAIQVDPAPIYARAKQIDGLGDGVEGTTLEAVVQASQDLGLLSWVDNATIRDISHPLEIKRALHRNGVLLAAFEITDQWMHASPDGWIPEGGEKIGGHACVLCAYDQVSARPFYGFQGSWGEQGWRGFNRLSPQQFAEQFIYALAFSYKVL